MSLILLGLAVMRAGCARTARPGVRAAAGQLGAGGARSLSRFLCQVMMRYSR
jgi:hypothetical protein